MTDKTKVEYYKNNIHINTNNPKRFCQSLKQQGSGKYTKRESNNIGLNTDGIVSSDKFAVVGKFYSFFTITTIPLVNNLPTQPGQFGK